MGSRQMYDSDGRHDERRISRAPWPGHVAHCYYVYACVTLNSWSPRRRRDDSSIKAPFTFSARQGKVRLSSFVPGLTLLPSLSRSLFPHSPFLSFAHMHAMLARFISADPEIIFRFGLFYSSLRSPPSVRACTRILPLYPSSYPTSSWCIPTISDYRSASR